MKHQLCIFYQLDILWYKTRYQVLRDRKKDQEFKSQWTMVVPLVLTDYILLDQEPIMHKCIRQLTQLCLRLYSIELNEVFVLIISRGFSVNLIGLQSANIRRYLLKWTNITSIDLFEVIFVHLSRYHVIFVHLSRYQNE